MTRPRYFPLLFIALSIIVYMHAEVNAGPLSLSFARSFRSGREIRTPFKSPGIMVARGYGKRNAMPVIEDGNAPAATGEKFTTPVKLAGNSGVNGGVVSGYNGDSFDNDRIPIDWLTTELMASPNLARFLLHRLLDINGDGRISTQELVSAPFENIEYY